MSDQTREIRLHKLSVAPSIDDDNQIVAVVFYDDEPLANVAFNFETNESKISFFEPALNHYMTSEPAVLNAAVVASDVLQIIAEHAFDRYADDENSDDNAEELEDEDLN